jgi:hypothetical protein
MMDGGGRGDSSGSDCQYTAASLSHNDDHNGAEPRRRKQSRPHGSRAVRLLDQLIVRELASLEGLARALDISTGHLEQYRAGRSPLPVHFQRRLADLVVSSVPELAREGRRLQLQCKAAEVFYAKETQTHMIAPPNRFR